MNSDKLFSWYNIEHYHSGIGLMTPESLHYGMAEDVHTHRTTVLAEAYKKHPNRFKGTGIVSRGCAVY
jgi:putative transposase